MNIYYYVIQNKNRKFYAGTYGKFTNEIKSAKLYKTEKNAINNFDGKDLEDYKNLKICKIKVSIEEEHELPETEFDGNYSYERKKSRASK